MADILMTCIQFDGKDEPKDKSGVCGQINVDFLITAIYSIYPSKIKETFASECAKRSIDMSKFQFIHRILDPEEELTLDDISKTLFDPEVVRNQSLQLIEIFKATGEYSAFKENLDKVLQLCEYAKNEGYSIQSFYY